MGISSKKFTPQEELFLKLRSKIWNCSKRNIVRSCYMCDDHDRFPITCQVRICPTCEKMRRYKLKKRLRKYMLLFRDPKLLTLTFKGHSVLTREVKQECEKMCKEFRRRMNERGYGINGFRFLEAKPKEDGFHIHFHYLIDSRKYILQKVASEVWDSVTKGSWNVDIRKIRRKQGLNYALKYASKPMPIESFKTLGFTDDQIIKAYMEFFYKRRMFTKLGMFYNIKLDEDESIRKCPICNTDYVFFFERIGEDQGYFT